MFHSNYFKIFSKPFPNGSLIKVASNVTPTVVDISEVRLSKIGVKKLSLKAEMVIFQVKWSFFGSRRRVPATGCQSVSKGLILYLNWSSLSFVSVFISYGDYIFQYVY